MILEVLSMDSWLVREVRRLMEEVCREGNYFTVARKQGRVLGARDKLCI